MVEAIARTRETLRLTGEVPLPGAGSTLKRWMLLADVCRTDLGVGRLVEGHLDAVAILDDLDGSDRLRAGSLAAVWAARPNDLAARRTRTGWVLDGEKPFCSGAGAVDLALVTAMSPAGPLLLAIDAEERSCDIEGKSWDPLGMGPTGSTTVRFTEVEVPRSAALGGPGAYVNRPGFWHGGCGVAACWWGGATALLDDVRTQLATRTDDAIAMAVFARAALAVGVARCELVDAATAIDEAPRDLDGARRYAQRTRFAAAEGARVVIDLALRHLGTSVLGVDRLVHGRLTDLATYVTQYKDSDAADLGRALVTESRGVKA